MNKTLTATLLILTSGLTLSAPVVAEPFTHGSGFVNANSNVYPSTDVQSTRSVHEVRRSGATTTLGGFNMRSVVESEGYSASSSAAGETPISSMFTGTGAGFNDRS